MVRSRARFAAVAVTVLMAALSGCGGDEAASGSGSGADSSGAVEAADTPQETARRAAPLGQDGQWEDLCLLMAEDDSTPYADYPDLMPECAEDAETYFGDISDETWSAITDTPDERVEEGTNGNGDPQLTYRDEDGTEVAQVELDQGDDGLFYFTSIIAP